MTPETQEHVAYLGALTVGDTIYSGHLYEVPEVGPDAYMLTFRLIGRDGKQSLVRMAGHFPCLDAAVTWGLFSILEYLLMQGALLREVVTLHPASDAGIDMDTIRVALADWVAVEQSAAMAQGSRATKH